MKEKLVKEKDKAFGRKVKNRDIDTIDKLCFIHKNGTRREQREAQAEILKYFDSYLEKYTNLFLGAAVDLSNYETRGFLAMFLTGRPKTALNLSHQKKYIAQVMGRFSREEVKAELTLLFLTVLDKYKIIPGVNALNPLTKIFRWRVKDWFNRVVKDPLFKTHESSAVGTGNLTVEEFIDLNFHHEPDFSDLDVKMDLYWVLSPGQNFCQVLSSYERYLILLVYGNDVPITQVADKLHRDKDTIKRHLKKALVKLKDEISDE